MIVALFCAICALIAADVRPAEAYVPFDGSISTTDGLDRAERLKVFRAVEDSTRSSNPATKSAGRRIMTRAFTTASKKPILRVGARSAAFGAALGIWTVVYYELKYYVQAGQQQSAYMVMDIQPSSGALYGWGYENTLAKKGAITFVEGVTWSVNQQRVATGESRFVRAVENARGTYISSGGYCNWVAPAGTAGIASFVSGSSNLTVVVPGYPCAETSLNAADTTDNKVYSAVQGISATGTYRVTVSRSNDNVNTSYLYGPSLCTSLGCTSNYAWPTFNVGNMNEQTAAPPAAAVKYAATPAESDKVVDAVVTDPEAPSIVPELPPADDPFWDDPNAPQDPGDSPEYPEENPQTTPAGNPTPVPGWNPAPGEPGYDPASPNNDPDQDGDPNTTDPDDDGDGIPDESDPKPWVPTTPGELPDIHPYADPDGDGIPNKDDPDDDGDGIPDEVDPDPVTPTNPQDLPLEHPYADPDGDEIPNKDDTDDDGDGIPDEVDPAPFTPTTPGDLPDEHPYADPDEDGTPNKDDTDDDGDGIPDEVDPNPYNPSNPDLQPDDPYADPDQDGTPNKDDTDDDGDGVPDVDDPAPYDPTVPGPDPDPTQDTDGDGYPDRNDPAPNDPTVPTEDPYQDADEDGWPNWNDPAPNDPTVPTGDPTSDTDGDGWPDFNDPAPNNPTVPTGDPTSDTDGDGTPDGSDPAPNDPNNPTGGGGGGGEDGGVCPVQKPYNFDVPRLRLFNVFPFSLVLKAWNIMQSLVMPPERPVFNVPLMGQLTVSDEIDAHVQTVKTAIAMVLFIGMLFWFWRMITGKGADGGAT